MALKSSFDFLFSIEIFDCLFYYNSIFLVVCFLKVVNMYTHKKDVGFLPRFFLVFILLEWEILFELILSDLSFSRSHTHIQIVLN